MNPLDPFKLWSLSPRLLILDTETTSLDGEVIEVACVNAAGEVVFDTRVKPTVPVKPKAQALHGISDEALADCPTWREVWPQLEAVIAGRRVVAYNAAFDGVALMRSLTAVQIELGWVPSSYRHEGAVNPLRHFECAMRAYSVVGGDWSETRFDYRFVSLEAACLGEGVSLAGLGGAHSARADASRTWRLIRALGERWGG